MCFKNWLVTGVLALSMSVGAIAAAEKPDGQITIDETQFGFLIGGSVGDGVLNIDGVKHVFKIGGLAVGANIGFSKMSASGDVYNLKKLADFPGNYGLISGSVTAGKGVGGMTLRNEKGVTMQLQGTTEGLQFNISASGVNVYFPK